MNQSVISYASTGFMARAVGTGLFRSLTTIKQPPANALSPTGGQAPLSDYTAVAGLSSIVCMDAPENVGGLSVEESLNIAQVESRATRHVLFDQYYPTLSPATNWGDVGWIAVVDSSAIGGSAVTYRLTGAECDSQGTMTRLRLEKVNV